jgi:nicotinamide riboside kinase
MSGTLKSSTETPQEFVARCSAKLQKKHRQFVMMTKAEYENQEPEQPDNDNGQPILGD